MVVYPPPPPPGTARWTIGDVLTGTAPLTVTNCRFTTTPLGTTISGENGNMNPTVATVETIKGWVGQIRYNGVISWESRPYKTANRAAKITQRHLNRSVRKMLA